MSIVLEFIFFFLLTCIVYLGVSFCPSAIREYLDIRNRMRIWIFIPLLFSSVFIIMTSAAAYVYLFEGITGYEFQHRASFGAGFLIGIYCMIWLNSKSNRKCRSK